MEPKIPTRMGDGALVEMTRSKIKADLEEGTRAAAKRAKVPAHPGRARPPARHLRLGGALHRRRHRRRDRPELRRHRHEDARHAHPGPAVLRAVDGRGHARARGGDYSLKVVSTNLAYEAQYMQDAQTLYQRAAAVRRDAQPRALLKAGRPLRQLVRAPAAGQDTRGARRRGRGRGDGRLRHGQARGFAVGGRRRRHRLGHHRGLGRRGVSRRPHGHGDLREKYPDLGVELGMASEFVLGMHGELEYEGVRLAGLWPREQLLLAQEAGATMFGPAVNINTGKSCAWNIARAIAIVKPCMRGSDDPGAHERRDGRRRRCRRAVPARPTPSRRAAKSCVELLQVDGYVGGFGRPSRDAQRSRAGSGHGRYASSRRPGGAHADDPRYASQGGQGVRGRQARRDPRSTSRTRWP